MVTIGQIWDSLSKKEKIEGSYWRSKVEDLVPEWYKYSVVPVHCFPAWYTHSWESDRNPFTSAYDDWNNRRLYFKTLLEGNNRSECGCVTIKSDDVYGPHTIMRRFKNSYFVEYTSVGQYFYFTREQLQTLYSITFHRSELFLLQREGADNLSRYWTVVESWFRWQDLCFQQQGSIAPYIFRAISKCASMHTLTGDSLIPGSSDYEAMMSSIRAHELGNPIPLKVQTSSTFLLCYKRLHATLPSDMFSKVVALTTSMPRSRFSQHPFYLLEL